MHSKKTRVGGVITALLLISLFAGAAAASEQVPSVEGDSAPIPDYRAGPEDLLSISVLDAPDLSRQVRVTASGEISLPLAGIFRVEGLELRAIETMIQDRLRKSYIRDPQVSVQVLEMQSHTISVIGAVNKPGTFQIRVARPLTEVLSLAQGLSPEAGDTAVITRANPAMTSGGVNSQNSLEVKLEDALRARNSPHAYLVYPGDTVNVQAAGIVYIVGEVNNPGSFPMKSQKRLTILQALALSQGLKPTAADKNARIIRTLDTGSRLQLPVNLSDIIHGKIPDVPLQERDILFVPGSKTKTIAFGTVDALVRIVSFRPY